MTSKLKVENQQKYNLICFYNFLVQLWVFIYFFPVYVYCTYWYTSVLVAEQRIWCIAFEFYETKQWQQFWLICRQSHIFTILTTTSRLYYHMYVPKLLYSLRRFFGITIWTFPALFSHFCAASNITGLHFRLQIS